MVRRISALERISRRSRTAPAESMRRREAGGSPAPCSIATSSPAFSACSAPAGTARRREFHGPAFFGMPTLMRQTE